MNPDININGKLVQLTQEVYDYAKGTKGIAIYEPQYSHGISIELPDNEKDSEYYGKPYNWFFGWEEVELVEEMNKYNIEVGDVCAHSYEETLGVTYTITKIKDQNGCRAIKSNTGQEGNYCMGFLIVIEKANKMNKKIIGYKLINKDNQRIVDKLADGVKNLDIYTVLANPKSIQNFKDAEILDKWFEPIYETKPTEVFVDTLAGKVRVDKVGMSLKVGEYLPMPQVKQILNLVENSYTTEFGGYTLKVETFKVGCKTFSVKDIKTLSDAIKQVSE